jgi:hypothetical protein
LSFSLNQRKSKKNASQQALKEIKKIFEKLKKVDLNLNSEENIITFFKNILILNFVTSLFMGLDLVKRTVDPNLKSWFDVYEHYNNPFRLSIELRKFFPITEPIQHLMEVYERSEEEITNALKEFSWAESAENLSESFKWDNNYRLPSITPYENITFDIFEQISHLLRNDKEQRTIFGGTVYTPYYLAKQIAEKLIHEWLNNKQEEKKRNNTYHDLKILDPAVGTGVFLIAAGNVICEKLEEENLGKTSTAIKKQIIETNLYGLDTDEIACYITRLKLLLWLGSNEKDTIPKLQPLLPNIDTGDSLVGYLQVPEDININEKSKDLLSSAFHKNMQKKLAIYQLPMKSTFQEYIEAINQDFMTFKNQKGFEFFIIEGRLENWNEHKGNLNEDLGGRVHFSIPEKNLDRVIRLYAVFTAGPLDNKFIATRKMELFHFKDLFHWCELLYPSKYDIIVGNPPFIALTDLTMKTRLKLKNLYPQIYTGNNDLSYFFLERMISLLDKNGILGFILPKYLQTSVFAKKIRFSIVERSKILEIHDFADFHIFSSTNVKACFLSLQRQKSVTNLEFTYYQYKKGNLSKPEIFNFPKSDLNPEKWIILRSESMQILDHIHKYSNHKLKDITMISKGIETGCDKVFAPKTPFFFSSCLKLEKHSYRPWIKGKEIKPFFIEREGREVLYAPKSRQYEIEKSYKILQYLNQYKKLLLNRSRVNKYYLWRDGDERNTMPWEENKIVCPYKAKVNTFAIDFDGSLSSKDVIWIVPKEKYSTNNFLFYLLGLLNSNVLIFYAQSVFKDLGYIYDFYPGQIQDLPLIIPAESSDEYKKLCDIAKRLQYTKTIQERDLFKKKLNRIVYNLFNLKEKEIKKIESNIMV